MVTGPDHGNSVPVTPGISFGTYQEHLLDTPSETASSGYFTSSRPVLARHPNNTILEKSFPEEREASPEASGTVLSVTFTLPQVVQLDYENNWVIQHREHCTAQLDSLIYLSSEKSSWNHKVVAWTGEINNPRFGRTPKSSIRDDSLDSEYPVKVTQAENAAVDEFRISCRDQSQLAEKLKTNSISTVPVWLGDENDFTEHGITLQSQSRWRLFAEQDLCSLFHYKQQSLDHTFSVQDRWHDYVRMNELFADKICQTYRDGDLVVVHDYYLMLVPAMLRMRKANMRIVLVLEAPFPTSELFRCLKARAELLHGTLGADMICFQAHHYGQHFSNCCSRILGYTSSRKWVDGHDGHRTYLKTCPLGIDTSKITRLAFQSSVEAKYTQLAKMYGGKKIIIGCDPWDKLSGLDKKLEAFRYFMDSHPEWQDRVVLIQFASTVNGNVDDDEHVKYTRRVHELATTINATYGSVGSTPVQIHATRLSQDDYFAILRLGDVALHTSIREGMSTTGLEYVACQRQKNGVLMLSEFSGTADNLKEAIHVNPWDIRGVSEQIHVALSMSIEERRRVQRALSHRVWEGNVSCQTEQILKQANSLFKSSSK